MLLALRPLPLEDQWAHQQENKITQSAAVAVAHDAQHPAGVKKAPTKEAAGSRARGGDGSGRAGGGQPDQPDQQEMGMILQLDIDMEAPVITMPRNSDSSDSLQVGLAWFEALHLESGASCLQCLTHALCSSTMSCMGRDTPWAASCSEPCPLPF